MKGFGKLLSLTLCAALLLTTAACSQEEKDMSSQVSTPSVSAVESEESLSSQPTPTPTPSPSPSPTPETESSSSLESSQAAGDFDGEFAANPIDAKLEEDLLIASSTTLIQQAYDTAAQSWQTLIRTAYDDSLDVCPEEEVVEIEQEQSDWELNLDTQLSQIREEQEDTISASKAVVDYYRQRAETLCRAVFEASGKMPQFPSVDGEVLG